MKTDENILSLKEALIFAKRESDNDGEIALLLNQIDAEIYAATGIGWNTLESDSEFIKKAKQQAKSLARLKLEYEIFEKNDLQNARIISVTKQLQTMAELISNV